MTSGWRPERYRGYLRVLAETELTGPIRRRVDPSDIVQETLLHAHRFLHDPPGSAGGPVEPSCSDDRQRVREMLASENRTAAWLRKILANTLRNLFRDHRAERRDLLKERSLEAALEQSSSRLPALLSGREPSPSARAAGVELTCRLTEAIVRLPADQQRAIILHRLRSLSVAEVAADMGRSADAVAGLIRRGLTALRRELDEVA